MSQAAVSSFMAFTGASPPEAAMFLEMSGGNVEIAVELFFGGGGGAAVAGGAGTQAAAESGPVLPKWFTLVWGLGKADAIPDAWLNQQLEFAEAAGPYAQWGLVQGRNGPCGVLAALNALLVAHCSQSQSAARDDSGGKGSTSSAEGFDPRRKPSEKELARAIARLIASPVADTDGAETVHVATWRDQTIAARANAAEHVDGVVFAEVPLKTLQTFIENHIAHFQAPGGLLLIVYSCVQSHPGGAAAVAMEASASGGDGPLITGPFKLCTSELLSLLLRGTGDGNVGAYGPLGGAKVDWPASMCPVGLLSMAEVDHSVPVCDRLKCPPGGVGQRVWILHGRDHFTFCFEAPNLSDDDSGEATPKRGKPSQSPASSEGPRDFKSEGGAEPDAALHTEQSSHRPAIAISLFHWNGLPPAGPRMTEIVVNPRANKNTGGVMEAAPAPKTSKEGVSKFHTPITGQIWDVVQAFPGDKKTRPDEWKSWCYEVVLAVPDPDGRLYGTGLAWPEGEGPPTFAQGSPSAAPDGDQRWRCATCYVKRHETMAFKLNEADAQTCMHCGRNRSDCGWSLWMAYKDLPKQWQGTCDRRHQPHIVTLLRTKWPGAEVSFRNCSTDTALGADAKVKPPSI